MISGELVPDVSFTAVRASGADVPRRPNESQYQAAAPTLT